MKLIIIGPQGSGKGTQAKLISEKYNIPHISTGDIFRENIREQTDLGKTAQEYINRGELVPDNITNALVHSRLSTQDCFKGFILDGFPRNIEQAKALERLVNVDKVIYLELAENVAVSRISSRRVCESCGMVYSALHDDVTKGCTKCGGKLMIRDDDTPDAVRNRLALFRQQTKPLVEYYAQKNILINVNGDGSIERVFVDIIHGLS
ncbi:adenylate kinase [Candidatus Woesearchaeota archaeon]|nr:adenylate kinase [Candidatus Woesearchaeota archaeon]